MSVFRYVTQPSVADSVRRVAILAITAIAALRGELMILALGMIAIGVTLALNDYPSRTKRAELSTADSQAAGQGGYGRATTPDSPGSTSGEVDRG